MIVIAPIGTLHYLYSVLPICYTIAMVCTGHRGDVLESLRWLLNVIAMT